MAENVTFSRRRKISENIRAIFPRNFLFFFNKNRAGKNGCNACRAAELFKNGIISSIQIADSFYLSLLGFDYGCLGRKPINE
jgi:hypothetical protein